MNNRLQGIIYITASFIGLVFCFWAAYSEAQTPTTTTLPVKWKQTGTWNGFEIVVNQDAGNILLSITNTTLKKSIPKTSFTFPVPDPKKSPEYESLAASFTQAIRERDFERLKNESLQREHAEQTAQYVDLIKKYKALKDEIAKDTVILMRFPKAMFEKKP